MGKMIYPAITSLDGCVADWTATSSGLPGHPGL
jgi:hypothetical protein